MRLDRPGIFHAYPTAIGLDQTKSGLASVNISFAVFEEKQNGEFIDVSNEQMTTIGYFCIEKKDGTINDFNIEAIRQSLGWNGQAISWLEDTDLRNHPVQITVDWQTYQGKENLKVQFLNPYGSTRGNGGVTRSDDKTRRTIESRIGAKLRAHAGGTSSPAPIPKERPESGVHRSEAPTDSRLQTANSLRAEAWTEFISHFTPGDPKWGQMEIEREWFRILEQMFPDITSDVLIETLTDKNWTRVKAEAPGQILPF